MHLAPSSCQLSSTRAACRLSTKSRMLVQPHVRLMAHTDTTLPEVARPVSQTLSRARCLNSWLGIVPQESSSRYSLVHTEPCAQPHWYFLACSRIMNGMSSFVFSSNPFSVMTFCSSEKLHTAAPSFIYLQTGSPCTTAHSIHAESSNPNFQCMCSQWS